MAIGTTGSLDPVTGERTSTQFEYTPADPQDDMMRQLANQAQQAFYPPPPQPRGPTPYWENPETYYPQQQQIDPIAQAKAATMAAQKFIAFRGYQQDLKEGASAADAFAKWGPMLVQDTSFGPSMKAMQPQPSYKYNEATRAYESPGGRPVFNPHAAPVTAKWVPANPQTGEPAHYDEGGKMQFPPKEVEDKLDPLTLSDYKDASAEFDRASKIYGDQNESLDIRKTAIGQMTRAQQKLNMIRKAAGLSPAATPTWQPNTAAQQQQSAPETPITITVTTKEQFDKLPSGAIYLNKGKKYRKP